MDKQLELATIAIGCFLLITGIGSAAFFHYVAVTGDRHPPFANIVVFFAIAVVGWALVVPAVTNLQRSRHQPKVCEGDLSNDGTSQKQTENIVSGACG